MSRLMLKPLKSFYGPIIAPKPIRHSPSLFHSYVNEPYHPIPGKKPKLVSAEEAVSVVKSGDSVFIQGTSATPLKLASALTTHGKASKLKDVRIHHILVSGDCEYNNKDCEGIFRSDSMFVGANCREAINDGRADFTPIFFSDFPKVFYQEIVRPDVALVQVTPADPHGYHSLGTSIDCTRAALQHAKYIIGQVNDRMPRTQGDASIHTSHFDALVEARVEMPEVPPKPLTDVEKSMGKYIAENLVEDGSTMQMGIGSIPDAVLDACSNHKNLGVHSEMFSDGLVDLVEKGVVTNNNKVIEQGKIVASFVIGTRKVFDFMHDNPFLTMRIPEFVNNQFIIAQNPKVVAINSCIEIDLVGNVAADTIGPKIFSGFGGLIDFLRGSANALDGKGKPILALPSTTNKGQSKIVPTLKPGSSVTATRAHVHYVVTEYGIANLFGRNLRQRSHALIQIAHPDHRESLEKAAFERLKCMPSAD